MLTAVDEYSRRVLHDVFQAPTLGIFHIRFRTRLLVLLVLQSIRPHSGDGVAAATTGNQTNKHHMSWHRLDLFLQFHPVVVFDTGDVAGDACLLGDNDRNNINDVPTDNYSPGRPRRMRLCILWDQFHVVFVSGFSGALTLRLRGSNDRELV